MHMPRPLKFKRNTDILKSANDVEEVANLAIVCQVALEECEDFDQPLTVTVECHLRSKVPLHEMTRLQRRTARSLAKRRAKTRDEHHGGPRHPQGESCRGGRRRVGHAGVARVSRRLLSRSCHKAAMMPAAAPNQYRTTRARSKGRCPGRSASPRSPRRGRGIRGRKHIFVEPRPPSSGYGREGARVAPAKKTPSLLSKPHATPTRSFGRSPTKKGGSIAVLNTAGRARFEDADVGALDAALAAERIGG